jgi:hypothetical protein
MAGTNTTSSISYAALKADTFKKRMRETRHIASLCQIWTTLTWFGNCRCWTAASFHDFKTFVGSRPSTKPISTRPVWLTPSAHMLSFQNTHKMTQRKCWLQGTKHLQLSGCLLPSLNTEHSMLAVIVSSTLQNHCSQAMVQFVDLSLASKHFCDFEEVPF